MAGTSARERTPRPHRCANNVLKRTLTGPDWDAFDRDGHVSRGVLEEAELRGLQNAIDDVMLGRADVDYSQLLMQLDASSGAYGDLGRQTRGFKGATLNYRKIQDLELHPVFCAHACLPLFREVCAHVYGEVSIACFRAMFMNKSAHRGTELPWHQDRWSNLDRDPLVTIWTGLDAANRENGCLEVLSGSQRRGVINPSHPSAFASQSQSTRLDDEPSHFIETEAGEVLLLHNWLLHRSSVNVTGSPRRAFSVCYMEQATRSTGRETYRPLFDAGS